MDKFLSFWCSSLAPSQGPLLVLWAAEPPVPPESGPLQIQKTWPHHACRWGLAPKGWLVGGLKPACMLPHRQNLLSRQQDATRSTPSQRVKVHFSWASVFLSLKLERQSGGFPNQNTPFTAHRVGASGLRGYLQVPSAVP